MAELDIGKHCSAKDCKQLGKFSVYIIANRV